MNHFLPLYYDSKRTELFDRTEISVRTMKVFLLTPVI